MGEISPQGSSSTGLGFDAYRELVYRGRTYRRFDESYRLDEETLRKLVDLGRMSPSGMNRQWLNYGLVWTEEGCAKIFPHLKWAASLPDWPGPEEGERPSAYIVVMENHTVGAGLPVDAGIACQSIMLGATSMGLGGVMISNMDRPALMELLGVDGESQDYHIVLVLAIGKVVEKVVVEPLVDRNDTRYWRVGEEHHVPKRSLEEVIQSIPFH